MPRGRKPKNQVVVDSNNIEVEETKELNRYGSEVCINHYVGEDYCTIYAGERKWYNLVLKMVEEHPNEVKVIFHITEGEKAIEAQVPYECMCYFRWPTKRTMTDEQREEARERMKKAQAARKSKKEAREKIQYG